MLNPWGGDQVRFSNGKRKNTIKRNHEPVELNLPNSELRYKGDDFYFLNFGNMVPLERKEVEILLGEVLAYVSVI